MQYVIDQPFGIGDILFLTPIAIDLQQEHDVIWPIQDEFMWLKDYFDINFAPISTWHDNNKYIQIPFRNAQSILNHKYTMSAKYNLVHLDHNEWKKLKWKRNIKKENELYYEILRLNDNDEYSLVNCNYAAPNLNYKSNINIAKGNRIYLKYINGFTLLDWAKVIENASEIHTVSTSLNYIVEVLYKKDMYNVHIYQRPIDKLSTVEVIGDILNKDWQIH
jgi:hypothetical protein